MNLQIYESDEIDTNSEIYYVDSGAFKPDYPGGLAIWSLGKTLHITVTNEIYQWEFTHPFSFNNWFRIAMSVFPDLGFNLILNGILMGFISQKTYRADRRVGYNMSEYNDIVWYTGRPAVMNATLMSDYLHEMYISHFHIKDRASTFRGLEEGR